MNAIKYLLPVFILFTTSIQAKGVYLSTNDFLAESFNHQQPALETLWLGKAHKLTAAKIMNRPVNSLRVRYWKLGNRTAWILEEIGKELPITIGIVIDSDRIHKVEILEYRESRGGEVRYPAFRKQFINGKLDENYRLNSKIDGITGATLSVRAVTRTANLALYYHKQALAQ
ncbi:MAG: FMN-binding protein [Pseudomonadales bacterium]|nr:FMN-binding protein [Pseudomonadales bacterium]MCP5171861.1 FMN-binding protein [Pseudomonadales bacterium]